VQTIGACQGQSLSPDAESEGLLDIKSGLHYTLYPEDATDFSIADRPATIWRWQAIMTGCYSDCPQCFEGF